MNFFLDYCPYLALYSNIISLLNIRLSLYEKLWVQSSPAIEYFSEKVPEPQYWALTSWQIAILKHDVWKSDILPLQIGIVRDLFIGIIRVASRVPVGQCVFIECPEYKLLSYPIKIKCE